MNRVSILLLAIVLVACASPAPTPSPEPVASAQQAWADVDAGEPPALSNPDCACADFEAMQMRPPEGRASEWVLYLEHDNNPASPNFGQLWAVPSLLSGPPPGPGVDPYSYEWVVTYPQYTEGVPAPDHCPAYPNDPAKRCYSPIEWERASNICTFYIDPAELPCVARRF